VDSPFQFFGDGLEKRPTVNGVQDRRFPLNRRVVHKGLRGYIGREDVPRTGDVTLNHPVEAPELGLFGSGQAPAVNFAAVHDGPEELAVQHGPQLREPRAAQSRRDLPRSPLRVAMCRADRSLELHTGIQRRKEQPGERQIGRSIREVAIRACQDHPRPACADSIQRHHQRRGLGRPVGQGG